MFCCVCLSCVVLSVFRVAHISPHLVDVYLCHSRLFFMASVCSSAWLNQRFVIGVRLLVLELRCYYGVIPSRVHSIVVASCFRCVC